MANPTLFLKTFAFICVFMVFWSRVPAEPTVSTTLHTRKDNGSLLKFECETETRPPRMLVQLIDDTVVTIVNEDKTLGYFLKEEVETPEVTLQGMHRVRVSQQNLWWGDQVDYKCLIDILIGNFSYQSNFSRRVSSLDDINTMPSEDLVRISPTYTIISEEHRMESSMTFRCYVNFQLTAAVRWSIVRDGHDNVELLDDNLEKLNNTKMKISVESSMMESVLNIDTIDLPADKYIISCRSRSRTDKDLSASATFEITDVDQFSKQRKLVLFLAVASCFFFVVHLITTFLLCYTCKKKKEDVSPPTPPIPMTGVVPDVADHPHSVTHFNHSNTRPDYVNDLDDDEEEQEDYVNHNQIKHHHAGYPTNKYRK